MSTMTATAAAPETVQVLKLNMLQDNPGAVKKVRKYLFLGDAGSGNVSTIVINVVIGNNDRIRPLTLFSLIVLPFSSIEATNRKRYW
jgi:hypothetical protein